MSPPFGVHTYFWYGFYTTTLTFGGLITVWLRNLVTLWISPPADFGDNRILLKGKDWTRTALSTFTLASAAITTTYFVVYNVLFHMNARKEDPERREPTEALLEQALTFTPLLMGNVLSGAFALLRCNQLWPKSKKLAVTSLALIASSVISAIGAITVALTTSSDNWGDPLGFLSIYTFIALAISVLVSAMIFKSAFQSRHNNISIIGTITESCIVTAATLLAILVYYHRNHRFLIALVPAFAMIHAAHSALIVSRIVEGKAFSSKTFENSIFLPGPEDSPARSNRGDDEL